MLEHLIRQYPSNELTPGVRILAGLMGIINLPFFIIGIFGFYYLLPLPGLFFYVYAWYIASDKAKRSTAIIVTAAAILYDSILLGFMLNTGSYEEGDAGGFYWVGATLVITIGFSAMNLRMLLEKKRTCKNPGTGVPKNAAPVTLETSAQK